ncbi:hypothetical protein K504DRAFT_389324 [Pleomassaria siparia CBS 279.74]|uniref:BYS1 domain protein n=1 Tax=Pleomassaria siparia CBS 279.74 TaxID=1314801 RepID=A0A6G1JWI6_9PLEO|nr:hypothetical protein K504DRAFT_389324 [Pleomassaria siparia CBS 279.74]
MRFSILSGAALVSSVYAVGNAIVINKSPSTFYVWSVGDSVGSRQTVVAGGNYSEPLHRAPNAGGIAVKITKTGELSNGVPTQIFSYSLDGANVWYDLSTTFGEPFKGQRITVTSPIGGTIDWPAGSNPGGSQVKVASSEGNVVFTAYAAV